MESRASSHSEIKNKKKSAKFNERNRKKKHGRECKNIQGGYFAVWKEMLGR